HGLALLEVRARTERALAGAGEQETPQREVLAQLPEQRAEPSQSREREAVHDRGALERDPGEVVLAPQRDEPGLVGHVGRALGGDAGHRAECYSIARGRWRWRVVAEGGAALGSETLTGPGTRMRSRARSRAAPTPPRRSAPARWRACRRGACAAA